MTPNFDLCLVFRLPSFIQPFTLRHFGADFEISNAYMYGINIFWAEPFGKIKNRNNWWRPMGIYDNGDDRPAILSELINILRFAC